MRKSLQVSFTAVFAALHTVLYFVSFGLWRNWGIYLEACEGIILGPKIGFLAALLGSSIARMIKPDAFWMFGIVAEPFSVLMVGFLAASKWKPVLAAYAVMLSAYFLHPYGRALPLWTIMDILLSLVLIYPAARFSRNLFKKDVKLMPIAVVLISFVCVATDSLARVFLLVPCGLYGLFYGSFEALYVDFVGAAASSYLEDFLVVIVSLFVVAPILTVLQKARLFEKNGEKK
jgi:uncharacterized membrane protein